MKTEKEELERICFNCNSFFPASMDEPTEYGICLNDKEFEPFLDEILDNYNYSCCKDLIERKKFTGDHEVCPDFSEVETEGCIEFDENSDSGSKLISSIKSGNINGETFEKILIDEYIRNIDFKTLPTDKYVKQLKSTIPKVRNDAISSLGSLSLLGNESAFHELFEFLKKLKPPTTIEEVHLRKDILSYLDRPEFTNLLTQFLLDELYNTPSNNTTRQWISAIFESLKWCPGEDIREPLKKMLSDKRFSYRLKQKIKNILYDLE